ncbi:unnamed protein product [Urochloa decumbens]|uniref:Uncharacterized protein n=1 Tax=Urochloa decumbens TaxID=240449 RepID=A0ABC9D9L4_9POAL
MAMAVRTALRLVLLVQVLAVLAAAARPLESSGDRTAAAAGGWLEGGIGMVTQLLGGAKSGHNPGSHCC